MVSGKAWYIVSFKLINLMAKGKIVRHRRADTGEYTTKKYADKHPKTTVKETDKVPKKKK